MYQFAPVLILPEKRNAPKHTDIGDDRSLDYYD